MNRPRDLPKAVLLFTLFFLLLSPSLRAGGGKEKQQPQSAGPPPTAPAPVDAPPVDAPPPAEEAGGSLPAADTGAASDTPDIAPSAAPDTPAAGANPEASGGAANTPNTAGAADAPGSTPAASTANPSTGAVAAPAEGGGSEGGNGTARQPPAELSAEESRINLDIRTSTLAELAAWCRSLGLSEGGTREALVSRLRAHYTLDRVPAAREDPHRRIIVIESSRTTEYFTLEAVDEDYARLQGDVVVTLKDGDATHRISAQDILYNRTRNIITARGGVRYVKEEGETIETFTGETITVNLDNWESIFANGVSERSVQSDDTTYRFSGTVISRNDQEVTVLRDATVANASNPESYWSLNVTKLWLLPGSDFAVFNAVLKVGEIPVLYIPFFYYPADEVVFHPVIGYRSREGSFVQTTTYIIGRPKAAEGSVNSFARILGNGPGMDKTRHGIFLRSTSKKSRNESDMSLKAIIDLYANLGGYIGTEFSMPRRGIFGATTVSAGFGITRDIRKVDDSFYTPFVRYDGTSDWNSSRFFSQDLPLRYRFNMTGSLGATNGALDWAIPYYADPFVNRDFMNRSEEMDWVNMVQQGMNTEEINTATDPWALGSYEWRFNGSLRPQFPFLAPYVSSFSLSSFSSTVAFETRSSTKYSSLQNDYSPNRQFFFPNKLTLYSMTFAITGTPFTLGETSAADQPARETEQDPLAGIGIPRSPWVSAEERTRDSTEPDRLSPPALSQRFDIPQVGGPQFSIDYRLNPSTVSELQFRSSQENWREAEDIDWSEVSSVVSTVRGDVSLGFNLNHPNGGMYSNSFRFTTTGSWQDFIYVDKEAEEFTLSGNPDPNKIRNARLQALNATYFNTNYEFTSTIRPLYRSAVWGNSSLQYSFNGLLAKSVFDPTSISAGASDVWDETPSWDVEYGAWDEDYLNSHRFVTNIAANVMDKAQTLTFTADLPPREAAIEGNTTLRMWISETNAHMRVFNPAQPETRKLEPFYLTETFRFGNYGSLQQYMVLDSEEKEYTTLTTNLSLFDFSIAYTAVRMIPYEFNYQGSVDPAMGNGWVQHGEEGLQNRDLVFGYRKTIAKTSFWKDRITFSLNLNTSMTLDLQRYTYSRLNFSSGFTLGIDKFLDLTFSVMSENTYIYRYFKDFPGFELPISLPEGEQNNFFLDLMNSFRFDDEERRKSSGFKLKSFGINAVHHLGDWDATLGVSLSQKLERPSTGNPYYKFDTEIAFLVRWIPISEIKTEMNFKNDEWTVK
jgi:lipopolysaccharide assembly outer membrane protein LptD (OstA)